MRKNALTVCLWATIILGVMIFYASFSSAWWNISYVYNQQINISNPTSVTMQNLTTINMTINTATLVSAGKLQNDCDDLRVVFNDAIEMNRLVENCNNANTRVVFGLRQNITSLASDSSNYKIYYANPSAANPPVNDNMSNIYIWKDPLRDDKGGWHGGGGSFGAAGLLMGAGEFRTRNLYWTDYMKITGEMTTSSGDNWNCISARATAQSAVAGTGVCLAGTRSGYVVDAVIVDSGVATTATTFYAFAMNLSNNYANLTISTANRNTATSNSAYNLTMGASAGTTSTYRNLVVRSYFNGIEPVSSLGDETGPLIREVIHIFNASTFEGARESIMLNISYNSTKYTLSSANLIYNGTLYIGSTSGSGDNRTVSKTFDIPRVLADSTYSFYWAFLLTNSSGSIFNYNSTVQSHTAANTVFALCNSTWNVEAVNYTFYDEADAATGINATFKGFFEWALGTGSVKENMTVDLGRSFTRSFCIYPNQTFMTSSRIELTSPGYNSRTYDFFEESLTNVSTLQKLFMINTSASSDIIIEVKDTGLAPLEDYLVEIYRKYPTSVLEMVESHKTDIYGQFVADLIENDVRYIMKIYDNDGTLVKTTGEITVACRSTICIVPLVVEDTSDPFSRYDDLENYISSLTFNNVTNTFIFSWTDNTGASPTHRLEVVRYLLNGTTTVCNSTSTSLSSSLSCAVGNSKASYIAQGHRMASPESRKTVLSAVVGDLTGTFGLEGMMWSFILVMIMVAIGIYNPPIGVGLYIVSVLLLGLSGIVFISPAIIVAEIVIGVLFIWAFRS